MPMKSVLCFGDSNTWGYNPEDGSRHPFASRWTGKLQGLLGVDRFHVIEEGLNGRTTVHNEVERPLRSAIEILPALLESHRPLDWVIVMLGTNDLKSHFHSNAEAIASNVGKICDVIATCEYLQLAPPRILVCSPTAVNPSSAALPEWFRGADEKARDLPALLQREAAQRGAEFLDVMGLLEHDFSDGLHWSEAQHQTVARHIAQRLTS